MNDEFFYRRNRTREYKPFGTYLYSTDISLENSNANLKGTDGKYLLESGSTLSKNGLRIPVGITDCAEILLDRT